jgi:endonuclease/exonuclease/phosphatase family metal-dependent hydrolase
MTRNQSEPARGNNTARDVSVVTEPPIVRIITHNIRYATESPFEGEELWSIRRPRLCSQLIVNSSVAATFICLQEVLHSQLLDIRASLNQAPHPLGTWSYIGVGRDDGKQAGEYSPIFYRPDVWNLRYWKTHWLSDTPNLPSKGWDAASIRIATEGRFEHWKTGQEIIVMSTHFDDQGSVSREESAKMILNILKLDGGSAAAVILAGDFNSPPDDAAYQIMTATDSIMEDVALQIPVEKRYGNEFTFTSFGHVDNNPSRIDFIFARKRDRHRVFGGISYASSGVLANRFDDGVYLSDHRACLTDIVFNT